MATYVPAQNGWLLCYIDDDTGLPFEGDTPADPIVAWRITEDPVCCEPVTIGERCSNDYVCISPDGRVVAPELSVFSDIDKAKVALREIRES